MTIMNLDKIFNPKSIAVVGASEKTGSVGASIMNNLTGTGFEGEILPVNPSHSSIMGLKAFPTVNDIDKDVDIAIIATPITSVPEIVKSCGRAGMAGVTILSAGGKEIGEKGKKIEADIMLNAKKTGLRILGPNCLGFMNTLNNLNASFAQGAPLPGSIAFLSQSGAVCTSVLDLARKENVGFSHFVSLGSMIDVDFADMIDYLGTIHKVESIVMYVENISNIRNFMSAARAVSRIKPIIALKAGRSKAGARAAASHTGALAGEDAVYDAAFKRAGILRVNEFEELFDCVKFLSKQNYPKGSRLAVVTNAGGPGVMAADALASYGVEPAELSPETIQKLDDLLPENWSRGNPVDILGDSSLEQYKKAAEICIQAPETDGLLIINVPVGTLDSVSLAKSFSELLQKTSFPVFTSWEGGENMDRARAIFNNEGIVTFDSPERAVRAFMNLYQYGRNLEMLQEIPVRKDKRLLTNRNRAQKIIADYYETSQTGLTEIEAKELLKAYGIPVNRTELAVSEENAAQIAEKMGFPVALKICSRDILHKSDSGGVILNLDTVDDVKNAFHTIIKKAIVYNPDADIMGVTVQTMHPMPDYELIIGAKKDKSFGPVIVFGMGGVLTEVFNDISMALPPLDYLLANRLTEETKIFKVFQGYRNIEKIDITLLQEMIIRVSRLVTDFPDIEELDINPVIVKNGNLMAVDARFVIKKSKINSPMHLVISSYPSWQEKWDITMDHEQFFMRPILPSDASLLIEHFYSLSPKSVYQRFFSVVKHLSKPWLIKFTQIDYDREIALVALMGKNNNQKIVGVSRIISEVNRENAEFAIAVSDNAQGKGIGASLLKRCLKIAKKQGIIKHVWAVILPENTQIRKLGKKLGFKLKLISGTGEYELHMDLAEMDDSVL